MAHHDDTHARTDVSDGVITVTIDRQAKRNAISPAITAALWDAVTRLADDDDLRVMLIAAEGPYFTAGIDLAHVPHSRADGAFPSDRAYRREYRKHHLLYDELETVEKPIVMAVQGTCLGAGVEMAASCDFRLASADATFRLPEIDLAVIPGSGGIGRLTRLVGPHWAKWMAMAGQGVDAPLALTMGFVHQVSPAERFQADVNAFVRRLAGLPEEASAAAKLVIDMAADMDRTNQRHLERIVNSALDGAPEFLRRTARFRRGSAPSTDDRSS